MARGLLALADVFVSNPYYPDTRPPKCPAGTGSPMRVYKLPFDVRIAVLPSRAGERLIRDLFEPLSYQVDVERLDLDPKLPEWGPSRYYSVSLRGNQRLQDLLSHINVLIPVLDDEKHHWVGDDEVEKLLRRGGEWLRVW